MRARRSGDGGRIPAVKLDHVRGTPGSRSRLEAQVWDGVRVDDEPATIPELAAIDIPQPLRETIERQMAKYPDPRSAVIPALRAAQEQHGWLSPRAIEEVAAVMRLTPAYLESVASFYDMFELESAAAHTIYVCTNISCTLRGATRLVQQLSEATGAAVNGTSADGEFRLRTFECLGACDIAPMAAVDGSYRGPLEGSDAQAIADHLRAGRPLAELLPDKSYERRYERGEGAERAAGT